MINKEFLKEKINSFYYPSEDKIPLPTILMVEPTNVCNLKCAMCYVQQQQTKAKYYLSLSDFQKIISQFPKIRELIFCGIGEPLLNKDIFDMVDIAEEEHISFINLVTNGKLLDEEIAYKIVKSGINRIQISVHSFNAEIFTEIRNEDADNLEKIKTNIKRLVAIKKGLNSSLKICCNAVVNKFNYDTMPEFIKDAKDLGIDRVEFIQMTTANDNLKDINAPLHYMPQISKETRRFARKINIEIGFLSGNDYGRCYQLWDFMMIHADGDISPCNGIFPTENIGLGNILYNPVKEIWNSQRYERLRESVRKGALEYCKYCESGYCLEGRDLRWLKNYYLRPLKRPFKHLLDKRRILD